jgi:hypothetical protein
MVNPPGTRLQEAGSRLVRRDIKLKLNYLSPDTHDHNCTYGDRFHVCEREIAACDELREWERASSEGSSRTAWKFPSNFNVRCPGTGRTCRLLKFSSLLGTRRTLTMQPATTSLNGRPRGVGRREASTRMKTRRRRRKEEELKWEPIRDREGEGVGELGVVAQSDEGRADG